MGLLDALTSKDYWNSVGENALGLLGAPSQAMQGVLPAAYSYGDSLKRKVGGLLNDPGGTLADLARRYVEEQQKMQSLAQDAGYFGKPSVLVTPQMQADARSQVADMGAQQAFGAATVWHGSPHKFDKFDSSKIGTGEGAQAKGYGLYQAGNPQVAQTYQFIDAHIDPESVKYGGRKLETLYGNAQRAQQAAYRLPDGPQKDAAISRVNAELGMWESMMTRNHPKQVIEDALNPENGWPAQAEFAKSLKLDKFSGVDMNPGFLYKSDLPDSAIAKMLDLDKPISQQVPEVQAGLNALKDEQSGNPVGHLLAKYLKDNPKMSTGEGVIGALESIGYDRQTSARMMRDAGITGTRYLDQFSRGTGTGTQNYVTFPGNEGLLQILERNGVKP